MCYNTIKAVVFTILILFVCYASFRAYFGDKHTGKITEKIDVISVVIASVAFLFYAFINVLKQY